MRDPKPKDCSVCQFRGNVLLFFLSRKSAETKQNHEKHGMQICVCDTACVRACVCVASHCHIVHTAIGATEDKYTVVCNCCESHRMPRTGYCTMSQRVSDPTQDLLNTLHQEHSFSISPALTCSGNGSVVFLGPPERFNFKLPEIPQDTRICQDKSKNVNRESCPR